VIGVSEGEDHADDRVGHHADAREYRKRKAENNIWQQKAEIDFIPIVFKELLKLFD
jgi:hypothetical protein